MTVLLWILLAGLLLCGTFLFLILPSLKKHPDLQVMDGRFIAHRGLHDKEIGIPENSLPSFQRAVDSGFPIEIDIHLTKDGHVIVFHDSSLRRMCNEAEGIVEKMTLSQLKEHRLLSTDETIPTLEECLSLVNGKVFLLIEFKYRENAAALCRAANEILSRYNGPYMIQSFHPQILLWYRRHRPDVCRGQLATPRTDKWSGKAAAAMLFNFLARPHFVSYQFKAASNPFFRLCIRLGAFPVGWTFRSREELEQGGPGFRTKIFENFDPRD